MKAYEEITFSKDLTLRWIREGNEYVCRATEEQIKEFKAIGETIVSIEREACIKLLEDFSKTSMVPVNDTWRMGLIAGANAIRVRYRND